LSRIASEKRGHTSELTDDVRITTPESTQSTLSPILPARNGVSAIA
jgi:hypothetical protein